MSEFTREDYDAAIQRIKDAAAAVDDGYKVAGNAASTICDVNQTVEYNPNITVIRNNGGDVVGYDYKYTSPTSPNLPAIDVDSNNDHGSYGSAEGGGGYSTGGGAGRNRSSTYAGTVNTDQSSTDKMNGVQGFVSGVVDGAWAAASALAKFGKQVGLTTADFLEAAGVDFEAQFGPLTIKVDSEGVANAIRVLYGVDPNTGETTMYMDEDTLGAMGIVLRDKGAFNSGDEYLPATTPSDFPPGFTLVKRVNLFPAGYFLIYPEHPDTISFFIYAGPRASDGRAWSFGIWDSDRVPNVLPKYTFIVTSSGELQCLFAATERPNYTLSTNYINNFGWTDDYSSFTRSMTGINGAYWDEYTYDNKTVYYQIIGGLATNVSAGDGPDGTGRFNMPIIVGEPVSPWGVDAGHTSGIAVLAWYMFYGTQWQGGSLVPGMSDQTGATIPVDAITGADPHVVAQNLASEYPNLMGSPVQIVVMDDSCNEKTINYYSVPFSYSPTNLNVNAPITGGLQVSPSFNPDIGVELPDVNLDHLIDQIVRQLGGSGAGRDVTEEDPTTGEVEPEEPTIPATGSGTTPPSVMPEANVTAMWHVYNPSSAALSALGSWLWSANIIDQIVRMFANPMEAIIGVHAIYTPPTVGGQDSIVVGNLTSSVSSNIVTRQYVSVDCGTVQVLEYFGNVFDYDPFTKISLYLPFVGIVPLRTADVMRSFLHIVYNVDVYTGACTAMVEVTRDGVGGVLYQFSGNCAVEYPISGANYSRMLQAALGSCTASLASGMASGGNPLLGAIAAGTTFTQGKMDFQRSGSFSGNPGAMGPKIPYLIITRPQPNLADRYQLYDGRGSNFTAKLKECRGYTKCKVVHLNVPGAYHDELLEIERLLKEGVMFPGGAEM